MKQWLEKTGRRINQWMVGRYGTDELSRFLLWCGIILMILSMFEPLKYLYFPALIFVVWSVFRALSKNIIKRSRERDFYLRKTGTIRNKIALFKRMFKDRKTHRYYKCPNCKTMVRVPKGKGRICITCTKCRHEFIKTT